MWVEIKIKVQVFTLALGMINEVHIKLRNDCHSDYNESDGAGHRMSFDWIVQFDTNTRYTELPYKSIVMYRRCGFCVANRPDLSYQSCVNRRQMCSETTKQKFRTPGVKCSSDTEAWLLHWQHYCHKQEIKSGFCSCVFVTSSELAFSLRLDIALYQTTWSVPRWDWQRNKDITFDTLTLYRESRTEYSRFVRWAIHIERIKRIWWHDMECPTSEHSRVWFQTTGQNQNQLLTRRSRFGRCTSWSWLVFKSFLRPVTYIALLTTLQLSVCMFMAIHGDSRIRSPRLPYVNDTHCVRLLNRNLIPGIGFLGFSPSVR